MAEKLMIASGDENAKLITLHHFAKQNLRDDVNFSFWEWFFAIMQLIKHKLLKFWDEVYRCQSLVTDELDSLYVLHFYTQELHGVDEAHATYRLIFK
ncbi:unnamed protein product [Gongylonema pulchrum]|uniref:Rab-GAP TBC domain-containing protein n=1 Tax=Gongylonema pulchrum TaxID=637853 RepID=A0A183EZZ5_9BILA|nr:unnamed protein product [Gongylonema pulchrum]